MWKVMVLQRFYGCLFCSSKKSLFDKMSDVGRFVIGECVTAKSIHVLHLSETQPVLSAEDELLPVLQPMPIVPDHTALLPVPPVLNPAPTDADPILSTNHEYNWYKYNNPDNLPLNGNLRAKKWGFRIPTGDRLDQSGDISKDYSPCIIFYFHFQVSKLTLQFVSQILIYM